MRATRVRADVLIEDLWAGPAGRNTLQSKVSQLRRALGGRELVEGTQDGYRLAVETAAVDATRATDLAARAAEARGAGETAASLDHAREGLSLFRGEVLPDAGDWAAAHRTRLEEVRMGLVEAAMAARVDLGAGGEVVGELESLVEKYPLREGLWASLVTALYRSGRQADALAAYGRVRRMLVDELGIEPGSALRVPRAAGAAAERGPRAGLRAGHGRSGQPPGCGRRTRGTCRRRGGRDRGSRRAPTGDRGRFRRRGQDPARPRGRSSS